MFFYAWRLNCVCRCRISSSRLDNEKSSNRTPMSRDRSDPFRCGQLPKTSPSWPLLKSRISFLLFPGTPTHPLLPSIPPPPPPTHPPPPPSLPPPSPCIAITPGSRPSLSISVSGRHCRAH